MAPDIAMYPEGSQGFWQNPDMDGADGWKTWNADVCYAWAVLVVECEWNHVPAFGFPTKDSREQYSLPWHSKAIRAHSQHLEQAAGIFRSQHRYHLFSVYVAKQAARLVYFDRAGMVVSEDMDLTEYEGKQRLCEFIYSLARMPDRLRLGYDPTVEVATQEDISKIPKNLSIEYVCQCRDEMIAQEGRFPIYKVSFAIILSIPSPTIIAGIMRRRRPPREGLHIPHRQASLESFLGIWPRHKGICCIRYHQRSLGLS